jgi:hypothetical protein
MDAGDPVSTSVDSDGMVATSVDGFEFTVLGDVLDSRDGSVWGNGDELFPVGAFRDDETWYVYYVYKGDVGDWDLGLASGPSVTDLVDTRLALDLPDEIRGGSDINLLNESTLVMHIVHGSAPRTIGVWTAPVADPSNLTHRDDIADYTFHGNKQTLVFRDGNDWFLYFLEEGSGSVRVRTAQTICDNIDNDCDGIVDNFTTSCGLGECADIGFCTAEVDSCTPGTPTIEICDDLDNDCNALVDDGFGQTTCGVGACEVTVENCSGGAFQTCSPGSPTIEICNGIDDDCNGLVDDGFGQTTCGIGACEVTVDNCAGGVLQTCSAGSPSTEICDNLDNDCDGTVDGFATACGVGECTNTGTCTAGVDSCVVGTPTAEICDNLDNDCDGIVDGFATNCGVGQCANSGTCTAGVDSCTVGTPSVETCNGADDDCSGQVDDGLGQSTCGIGACEVTVDNCIGGIPQTCNPGTPTTEICDNLDNDCDGTVDGFATSCGVGECANTGTCTAGVDSCVVGAPIAEICDNLDNDCDGTVDGFSTNCGVGQCAGTGTCAAGVDSCTVGTPAVETCNGLRGHRRQLHRRSPPDLYPRHPGRRDLRWHR